jgi:XTP/dITP diphosphohydrolase
MDLLLATSNRNKTREFATLLGADFHVADLTCLPSIPLIIESGHTFEENAAIKALAVSRLFQDKLVVADDSGLEVDSLGGAPGIFSARYAGEHARDEENVRKLLSELKRANSCSRRARFVCALAMAKNEKLIFSTTAMIEGTVAPEPRGSHGFGYDPVFIPHGSGETFAELPAETKNKMSHRAFAARKLAEFLRAARPSW